MDITPSLSKNQNLITRYGAGGFGINGVEHRGSLLLFAQSLISLPVTSLRELTPEMLPLEPVELLLIGSGARMQPLLPELKNMLRQRSIGCDVMDTGAACRTYNVLLAEGRSVGALLIAV